MRQRQPIRRRISRAGNRIAISWFMSMVLPTILTITTAAAEPSWTPMNDGLAHQIIFVIELSPVDSSVLYVGTADGGVYRSTNGGVSWMHASSGLGHPSVLDLAFDPGDSSILYAATSDTLPPVPGGGVFRTANGGLSWDLRSLFSQLGRSIAVDSGNSSLIYAGIDRPIGILRSEDAGLTWASSGIESDIRRIVSDKTTSGRAFLTGTAGVRRTTNGGLSWEYLLGNSWGIAIDPSDSQVLYAGLEGAVFKSVDGGNTWFSSSNGLPSGRVFDFAIDPSDSSIVYAAFGESTHGVFVSRDAGATWSGFNDGLTFRNAHSLAIDPVDPRTLYVGTAGGGVFKYADDCSDADEDGFGSPGSPACPGGSDQDCDDLDAATHPSAVELCDGRDNDCDGAVPADEMDLDEDGFRVCGNDCDDSDPTRNPSGLELPGNAVDENCDGSLGACDPFASYRNHGQFVRCVAHEVNDLLAAGLITEEEGEALVSSAARSDIGK